MNDMMKVNYLLSINRRDQKSIAYDMEVEVSDLTPNLVREWMTMLICDELKELRKERTSLRKDT